MTAKEKAQELISKFMFEYRMSGEMDHIVEKSLSKQCAFIAIDQILEAIYSIIGKEKHLWRESEKDSIDYWESVKLEISSL